MRRRRLIWGLLVTTLVAVAGTGLLGTAKAANPAAGVQLKPLRSYPNQDPGQTTYASLTLTNLTDQTQTVSLSAERFKPADETYRYTFDEQEVSTWVSFTQPTIVLQPKQASVVNYALAVPADASPGGRYIALLASINPVTDNQKLNEIHRVASLVYLEINGDIVQRSQLVSLDSPSWSVTTNLPATVRIANTGNSHYRARTDLSITRWPTRLALGPPAQLEGLVLPGTVRQLPTKLWLGRSPGIYRLTATYTPPQGGTEQRSRLVIYLPPWFLVIVAAAGLFGIYEWRHARRHKRRLASPHKDQSAE